MKSYIKIQIFAIITMFSVMYCGCTDHFAELNTSNSLVTEDLVNVDLMLTRVQAYAIHLDASNGTGTLGNFAGMNSREDNRPFAEGDAPGAWNNCYGNYGRNLADIIRICQKRDAGNGTNDLVNKIAIARILKVWAFSVVTDTYGDIPYFESCLPVEEAVLQPKYDTQESIYEDFFKELKEAAAQLDASKASYGSADLIYGGNVDKWKKLANSLRLRLALRVSYVDEEMARANMSDLTEANLITSLADEAFINSASDYPTNQNSLYTSMINSGRPHTSHYIGKTYTDIMIGSGDAHNPDDPRIKIYCDTAYAQWPGTPGYEDIESFGYRGRPILGVVPVEEKYPWGSNTASKIAAFWYAPIIERPLLRSAEVYFALAEAALTGLKTGIDAEAMYKKGIDLAMGWTQKTYTSCKSQMPAYLKIFYSEVYPAWSSSWESDYFADKEISQAEIDAFKTKPAYSLTGTIGEKLEKIINQKVIALYPDENQGWFEFRRTGYPRILIGSDTDDLVGKPPRRMPWPQIESSVNSVSYEEALTRIGGAGKDNRLTRIWWDANPDSPHPHPETVPTMDHPWVQ